MESQDTIFLKARDIADPVERAAYLTQACGHDADLRGRVEAMLRDAKGADKFFGPDATADRTAALQVSLMPDEAPGNMVGPYKLLQKIGEGGCGVVYMAEQQAPIRRRVALKIIKIGMDTQQVVARFEAEQQALALMDHPNIARVLEAGTTEKGRPYFVMELVRGVPITEFCDQSSLTTRERLELFIQVCRAIQHAHQKGIIHRDIKPTNVLVTLHDGVPVPKVIDFGVAKAIDQPLTEKTLFTRFGQFIGTPAYMSPEQAEMSGLDIDTRTDIYSLGVLLYELLAGRPPFDPKDLLEAGLDAMRHTIREQEPPPPSRRLSTLADADLTATAKLRRCEPAKLPGLIRGDLDWIVMKALEKNRQRRYETPDSLSQDVARYLNNEPIVASPPSTGYLLKKFVRRHWAGVSVGAALALTVLCGTAVSISQAVRATRAEREQSRLRRQAEADEKKAQTEAAKSQQVSRFLQDTLQNVASVTFRDRAVLGNILEATANRIGQELKNQPEVEAELWGAIGQTYQGLGRYAEAEAMYREVLVIQKQLFGNEHPSVAASLDRVANVLSDQGKHTEAEMMLRDAIAMGKKLLGNEHPNVADSLDELALVLLRQSQTAVAPLKQRQLAEAEDLEREASAIRRKVFGNEHLDVAQSLDGLALVFHAQGKTAEAESMLREALAMRRKLLGGENRHVAMSLLNLADALGDEGKYAEAEPLFREALAMRRKLDGNEHPDVAYALGHLAVLLHRHGKLAEAEAANREALVMYKKLLGNEHPNTIITLDHLAAVLRDQGKLAEAEAVQREAAAMRNEK